MMARKGRKPTYKPFRAKKDGIEYGGYRLYVPTLKKTISLNTEDPEVAELERNKVLAELGIEMPQSSDESSYRWTEPVTEPPTVNPIESVSPLDAINRIVSGASDPQPPISEPFPQPESPPIPLPRTQLPTPSRGPKPPKGLSPEQAAMLGRGLMKICAKVNIVAGEFCVKSMGRDPFPLDHEETQLLGLGWEMVLEQYFVKNAPEPWHVLLAANVMMIASMYMRGENLPPKPEETYQ